MNRLGLRFAFSADILTVGIVCLALSNLVMFYVKSHPPIPAPKEPTIDIEQTYFISVPQPPKVIVKIVPAPAPKPQVRPQRQPMGELPAEPVFTTRRVIIPDSLNNPIEAMNVWHVSGNQSK
jgi:hypothetical protein